MENYYTDTEKGILFTALEYYFHARRKDFLSPKETTIKIMQELIEIQNLIEKVTTDGIADSYKEDS